MLILSLVFSLLMLAVVNMLVCRSPRVGGSGLLPLPFLVLGICSYSTSRKRQMGTEGGIWAL